VLTTDIQIPEDFENLNKTDQNKFFFKNYLIQEKLYLTSYSAYRQKWLDLSSLIKKSFDNLNKQENHYVYFLIKLIQSTRIEFYTITCLQKS
jgi:hypothetical protein